MRRAVPLFCLALLVWAGGAAAQSWPDKPVRIILGGGPGTVPDVMGRLVAEHLAKTFGRPFVIENMTGGAGLLAPQAAARAAPDGYTFLIAGVGVFATDRYTFKTLPYNPDKDFAPVAVMYDTAPFAVAVHPDVPVRTIAELVALAKKQPGKLSYGTDTVGVTQIVGRWFNRVAATNIVEVPYKSVPQMLQDAVGGQIGVVFNSVGNMESFRRSGKLRVLAITADRRLPLLPDVPTVGETLAGFKVVGIGVLAAPSGTPTAILERVNRTTDQYLQSPEYQQRLGSFSLGNRGPRTLEQIQEFLKSERDNWARIMQGLNVQAQ